MNTNIISVYYTLSQYKLQTLSSSPISCAGSEERNGDA